MTETDLDAAVDAADLGVEVGVPEPDFLELVIRRLVYHVPHHLRHRLHRRQRQRQPLQQYVQNVRRGVIPTTNVEKTNKHVAWIILHIQA